MRSVNNSVETINAAATAIVSAESRVQPEIPKKRWSSCWSPYWCFGSHKNGKRFGHAVLVPEPVVQGAPAAPNEPNPSTSIVMPFIAPPSSPASFLQSDPPSATQSPAGFLSLTSLSINSYSPGGPASVFAIGPYAYETQLVSPPVFSTYTTEPSTAPFTPPPESVQLTTPSSPEVPFAQLLTSSLARPHRNSGTNQKFGLSHYEFQPYQQYPGSPGGQLISPGSTFSNSGTSTPFPDRRPIIELRMGEPPKILGFEYFSTRKWGSRLGSGSLTPDGGGLGSRLGSGSLTPDGVGLVSRLGSGSLTPDGLGQDSRLGSGALTPNGMGSTTRDKFIKETRISEVASLANSENVCQTTAAVIDHRVSFELTGEDVARCLANKSGVSSRIISGSSQDISAEGLVEREGIPKDTNNCCELSFGETFKVMPEKALGEGEEQCYRKHRFVSLGSIKEFNFVSTKGEISDKPTNGSQWWLTTR